MTPAASVIIPAHNEARVIGRNLALLQRGVDPGELDVVVVANGCSDDTVEVARRVPGVRVLEIVHASKTDAVRFGNLSTDVFPRVHLDADVALSGADVRLLVAPLREEGLLATAPRRMLDHSRSHWLVRWYHDVWEQLPQVRSGLFGRGAIALSREGQARVDALPDAMSDDLLVSEAFADHERRIVEGATVTVVAPATVRDLVRRRIRVATGNSQAGSLGMRRPESVTSPAVLRQMVRNDPRMAPRVAVFLGVAVVARIASLPAVRAGSFRC